MVAMFRMCEGKVDNLIYYLIVFCLFSLLGVANGWLQATCFINFFIRITKVSDFSCIIVQSLSTLGYVGNKK